MTNCGMAILLKIRIQRLRLSGALSLPAANRMSLPPETSAMRPDGIVFLREGTTNNWAVVVLGSALYSKVVPTKKRTNHKPPKPQRKHTRTEREQESAQKVNQIILTQSPKAQSLLLPVRMRALPKQRQCDLVVWASGRLTQRGKRQHRRDRTCSCREPCGCSPAHPSWGPTSCAQSSKEQRRQRHNRRWQHRG